MNEFSLEDIRNFILEMEKSNLIRTKEYIKWIPLLGRELYKRALFKQTKIDILKKQLSKVENGSIEEQQRFINEFTPILLEAQQNESPKKSKSR